MQNQQKETQTKRCCPHDPVGLKTRLEEGSLWDSGNAIITKTFDTKQYF